MASTVMMTFSLRFAWWVPVYLRCIAAVARFRLLIAPDGFDFNAFSERHARFVVKHGCKMRSL